MTTSEADFLPFALPDVGEEEIAEVTQCLRSGWLTSGPKAKEFEQLFGEYLGAPVECVAVNSATAGLHLALEALDIGPGDEVIVPTHTFTATAEVVRYLNADPVFVDVRDDYCIDAEQVARAVTPRTKAIVPVHYAGYPAAMDDLRAVASRSGLAIVEDAAHAFPTRYKGSLVGTLDTACAVFSFYATKTLATGEGGMLVTSRPELARRARIMRLHGIDRDAFDRYRTNRPAWQYQVVAPGFKYNLTDVAAALGVCQLRKADSFAQRRAHLAKRYDDALRGLPLAVPPSPTEGSTHAWHLYVVRLSPDAPVDRDGFIERLYAAGVGCSVHYIPLHLQPYWRDRYGLDLRAFPVSQRLYETSVSLPLYTKMSDADQDRVVAAVRATLR